MGWYDDHARQVRAAGRILKAVDRMCSRSKRSAVSPWAGTVSMVSDEDNAYVEPGYCSNVVCLADWNDITRYDERTRNRLLVSDIPTRTRNALGRIGIACEWCAEWSHCGGCGRLVRTRPDCLGWAPSYHYWDGELVCIECADHEQVLRSLHGSREEHVPRWIDPAEYGYVPWHTYRREVTDALDAKGVEWVVDHKDRVWCSRSPIITSKDHMLSVLSEVMACTESTRYVVSHESDDACVIVKDRTHPKGDDWARWLFDHIDPIDTDWYKALEARVRGDRE